MTTGLTLLRDAIVGGLNRSSIKTCSQWACKYRVMGKPVPGKWTFEYHPWLREMHDCTSEVIVGQKAAQMGFTEWALNRTFFAIDVLGDSVLYVLPSDSDASDFSASRFDPALEMSDHLSTIFSDVKNVGHKRAGSASLFVRGSRSRSKLKSLPAARMKFDEVDEMVQENIPLALERMSGQPVRSVEYLSTPTLEGYGINKLYEDSTQNHYFFKCSSCSRLIELTLDNLVITAESSDDPGIKDSHIICLHCKNVLHHEAKRSLFKTGRYIQTYTNRTAEGYHINQLYSVMLPPSAIAKTFLDSKYDPAAEQELYNSKLGLCHATKGAQLTEQEIESRIGTYTMPNIVQQGTLTTMGVDVGKHLHVVIRRWYLGRLPSGDVNTRAVCHDILHKSVDHFEQLDELMRKYYINQVVIDANPERRKSLEFCQRFAGIAKMCFYGNGVTGRTLNIHAEDHAITVDRTSWLDAMFVRYRNNSITLPMDTDLEFKEHMRAPVRIHKKDADGNPVGKYVNSKPDHYAHASNYAEIALALFSSQSGSNEDIK